MPEQAVRVPDSMCPREGVRMRRDPWGRELPPRVVCPECGTEVDANRDGTVSIHPASKPMGRVRHPDDYGDPCAGTNHNPA